MRRVNGLKVNTKQKKEKQQQRIDDKVIAVAIKDFEWTQYELNRLNYEMLSVDGGGDGEELKWMYWNKKHNTREHILNSVCKSCSIFFVKHCSIVPEIYRIFRFNETLIFNVLHHTNNIRYKQISLPYYRLEGWQYI